MDWKKDWKKDKVLCELENGQSAINRLISRDGLILTVGHPPHLLSYSFARFLIFLSEAN